jgi:signal transduction histidine kinase
VEKEMSYTERPLADLLRLSTLRWMLISSVAALVLAALIGALNLCLSANNEIENQLESFAHAFRQEILSGEFKQPELSMARILNIKPGERIKILSPNMQDIVATPESETQWPADLQKKRTLWDGPLHVFSATPIFFDEDGKELFGYIAAERMPSMNWPMFFIIFSALMLTQAAFAWNYRKGVVKIGEQLGRQLQSLENEFLQNAPHLSQDSRASIQELNGIRTAFLELRQASLKNNNLKKLAHDIRSPLTALSIAIRSLGNEQGPAKELLEQSYERMESISRDILAPPKTAGLTSTSIPIETLIHKLIKEKRAEYSHRQLKWETDLNLHGDVQLAIDSHGLTRCLSNLMNNGAEASPSGTAVRVTVGKLTDTVQIEIQDSGAGIPNGDLDRILKGGFSTKLGGNGIGLSSAKEFIEQASGKFEIDNIGHGCRIRLTLPLLSRTSA